MPKPLSMIPRVLIVRALRQASMPRRPIGVFTRPQPFLRLQNRLASTDSSFNIRPQQGKTNADEAIEDITELYATAQDEFEIAMEETEKMSVYAEEDRKAARDELTKVQEAYKKAVEGPDENLAAEVQRRIGQRIRELEQGVKAMEELAQNQD